MENLESWWFNFDPCPRLQGRRQSSLSMGLSTQVPLFDCPKADLNPGVVKRQTPGLKSPKVVKNGTLLSTVRRDCELCVAICRRSCRKRPEKANMCM